ncbi:hypothetical protein [Actinomadura macrotermitis]|uniref:Lipoprotein n=1 Tax=Actinomadura macrotermitis TaxID=2585200 RepID=A0A7K0C1P4_9ACTN|nr:hypothetical protein [Actinomadura macrotermitis]MQY07367.1 hypothetical protein [Actinomadura macrotermitis]
MRLRIWAASAAVVTACGALLPSSAVHPGRPVVDAETTRQLTAAARTLIQLRSAALVQRGHRDRRPPAEILGVLISPGVARGQERAVQELENRNRAPVAGGPVYTAARTRLDPDRAVRLGDRITLDATEHTEVRYETGALTQSVRRRFEFTALGPRIVLVREGVLDPAAHPLNDPADPNR